VHLSTFPLFLAAAAILALTPGPGLFYVAARTIAGGRADGFASTAGNAIGGLFHVLAGAIGVSALVTASAEAFSVLKFAGAVYLVWLGIRTFRDTGTVAPQVDATGVARAFRDGVLVEAFNPKTAAFFLAFIPQFIDPAHGVAVAFATLGLISVLFNSMADMAAVWMAWRARAAFARRPELVRSARQTSGLVLCGLGVSLAFARRGH
jgi:threonine/homoserine/homoserine lactone efflux protein